MEITTAEECHVVGLFPDAAAAEAAGAEVGATLDAIDDGYETFFGEQHLLDAAGLETGRETLALATATTLDVDAAVALVHRHGGLAVAAHIDRKSFGVIGQLGFFPAEAGFDAVELSRHVAAGSEHEAEFAVYGLPVLHSSDAHYVQRRGRRAHRRHLRAPQLRRAGARRPRSRGQARRRCMTSRSTCSTSSRTRCAPGRR